MTPGTSRGIADILLRLLVLLAPRRMRDWADAVLAEAKNIPDDHEALRFVAETGPRLAVTFVGARLGEAFGLSPDGPSPRLAAIVAASLSVAIGVVYLRLSGAPSSMVIVNIASLIAGLALVAGAWRWRWLSDDGLDRVMIAAAVLLLLTGIFGINSHGAVRWVAMGPLMVQSSLILLPTLIMLFVRKSTPKRTAALLIAASAVALQPDRAMAGALCAGAAVLAIWRPTVTSAVALAASGTGFVITLVRTDNLPPSQFAEGVFASSWQLHPLLGVAVAGGSRAACNALRRLPGPSKQLAARMRRLRRDLASGRLCRDDRRLPDPARGLRRERDRWLPSQRLLAAAEADHSPRAAKT